MKPRLTALTAAIMLVGALPVTAAVQVMTPIQVVNVVVAASATQDTTKIGGLYAADAIFVDEGPPFRWSGANAGVTWSNHIKSIFTKMKMREFTAIAQRPRAYNHTSTGAYVVIPMVLDGAYGTKHFHESGTFTFTLRRDDTAWRITSQVWTLDVGNGN